LISLTYLTGSDLFSESMESSTLRNQRRGSRSMDSARRMARRTVAGPALKAASVMRTRSFSFMPGSGSKYLRLIHARYLTPA
jgi:hypothetical protein